MSHKFNEKYYQSGNYKGYLDRYDRYHRMVTELHQHLVRCDIADVNRKVVDYGCSVGFVVKALEWHGYKSTCGYDISEWAVGHGNKRFAFNRLTNDIDVVKNCYMMFALDVFEHMDLGQISYVLDLAQPTYLILRVPTCYLPGDEYTLKVSRDDPTHKEAMTYGEWKGFMKKCGYISLFDLNLHTIYTSEGVLASVFRLVHV